MGRPTPSSFFLTRRPFPVTGHAGNRAAKFSCTNRVFFSSILPQYGQQVIFPAPGYTQARFQSDSDSNQPPPRKLTGAFVCRLDQPTHLTCAPCSACMDDAVATPALHESTPGQSVRERATPRLDHKIARFSRSRSRTRASSMVTV
jgi:hypothetical protein